MLAHVTNRAENPRGFGTAGGVVFVEPGETYLLDLADHPVHDVWAATGEVTIEPLPEKDAKAMRKRLEARSEAEAKMQSEALAALPSPV